MREKKKKKKKKKRFATKVRFLRKMSQFLDYIQNFGKKPELLKSEFWEKQKKSEFPNWIQIFVENVRILRLKPDFWEQVRCLSKMSGKIVRIVRLKNYATEVRFLRKSQNSQIKIRILRIMQQDCLFCFLFPPSGLNTVLY